eukprot:2287944-Amphidinium_carterae.1
MGRNAIRTSAIETRTVTAWQRHLPLSEITLVLVATFALLFLIHDSNMRQIHGMRNQPPF